MPLNIEELQLGNVPDIPGEWEQVAFNGFYPRLYDRNIPAEVFYNSYLATYVERDL